MVLGAAKVQTEVVLVGTRVFVQMTSQDQSLILVQEKHRVHLVDPQAAGSSEVLGSVLKEVLLP